MTITTASIATLLLFLYYRAAVSSVQLDGRKRADLDACDVVGGDVDLRDDDVIAVGVEIGELAPDRK